MRALDAVPEAIHPDRAHRGVRGVAGIVLLAGVYYGAARLGLRLALVDDQVTPFWPPTGVAVAALLVFGARMWPGIALGAFLVNLPISESPLAAAAIAVGNTLAPIVAVRLLQTAGFRAELDRVRDGIALVFLGGVGMLVSATGGATTLVASGAIPGREFAYTWSVWWTGDTMGVLLIAPFLLTLRAVHVPPRVSLRRAGEAALLFVGTAGVAGAVARGEAPLLYSLFPFTTWAAWRFQQRGAAPAALLISGVVTWAAGDGSGPFAGNSALVTMYALHAFNATLALTSFMLAAARTQHVRAYESLEHAGAELERRVRERTAELSSANAQLAGEVVERERAENALRRAYEREREAAKGLRESDRMKDEFLSTVSHELRTPLTVIVGFGELLRRRNDLDPELREELVRRIHDRSVEMARLVEQILDDSRLRAGKIQVRPRPLGLGEALRRCVEAFNGITEDHPVSIQIDTDLEIEADPDALDRILGNLLANAAKFSPPESPIVVRARPVGPRVVISVGDQGVGIAPGEQDLLFERFYEGGQARSGVGLGLSIVRQYTELQGGRVWVESRPGTGSTFSFSLPRAHVEAATTAS